VGVGETCHIDGCGGGAIQRKGGDPGNDGGKALRGLVGGEPIGRLPRIIATPAGDSPPQGPTGRAEEAEIFVIAGGSIIGKLLELRARGRDRSAAGAVVKARSKHGEKLLPGDTVQAGKDISVGTFGLNARISKEPFGPLPAEELLDMAGL
jgi:hypothetical protein